MEFGVGVGERLVGSNVDATLHRDASPAANPEGYTLRRLSVDETRDKVVRDGGDDFGAEIYITCRTEDVYDESVVESVMEIEE